ncbi:PepSY-associated TM helix domain-containing protein [Taibaiella soli]|uniref:PepSY domain-containing protein n=1 Tax=Taibaiella soli TaxID=1649169 RepID=A0A2W2AFM1_9BACT|nr:PepSY-associated TM helix domain-containing protein [Taibaiella soli]PZF74295.1 PepSY domain-containing protein [Taibaiella soli]
MTKKKHNKSLFKQAIGKIHLWLGLASGLVVFIVAITGCIYAFQDDIRDLTEKHRFVTVEQKPVLAPSILRDSAMKRYPDASFTRIIYSGNNRSATVMVLAGGDYHNIFLNPYSGAFLADQNLRRDFFTVVEYIHLYLLLPANIGKPIVDVAVVIFVVMMITGIILWWPRNKAQRKQSFKIKWSARWRRVNYDLHNVLGFYALIIALIIAISGLSMSYEWVRNGLNKTANLGHAFPEEKQTPQSDSTVIYDGKPMLDAAYAYAAAHTPNAQMFMIYGGNEKKEAIIVSAYAKALHFYHSDTYFVDRATGKVLKDLPHTKKSAGLKLNEMSYDLHTGQILGFVGKIIAFLASLIAASLPITGFMVWWGKRKSTKKKMVHS